MAFMTLDLHQGLCFVKAWIPTIGKTITTFYLTVDRITKTMIFSLKLVPNGETVLCSKTARIGCMIIAHVHIYETIKTVYSHILDGHGICR